MSGKQLLLYKSGTKRRRQGATLLGNNFILSCVPVSKHYTTLYYIVLLFCLLRPPYPLPHISSAPTSWPLLRAKWIPHFSPPELSLVHTRPETRLINESQQDVGYRADSYVWNTVLETKNQMETWGPGACPALCSPRQDRLRGPAAVLWSTTTVRRATWRWVVTLWRSAAADCRWREGFIQMF